MNNDLENKSVAEKNLNNIYKFQKTIIVVLLLILSLLIVRLFILKNNNNQNNIQVINKEINIKVNDTYNFFDNLKKENIKEEDVSFEVANNIGEINNNIFVATKSGETIVKVKYDDIELEYKIIVSAENETTNSQDKIKDFELQFLKMHNEKVNKLYSPLSIKYALHMLNEGANGNTKTQIDNVLGKSSINKYENNSNMSFANALFIKETLKNNINISYIDNLKNKFNAEIIYDSFGNPSNLNNWVSNKTFNLINNLFDDSISNQLFILVNALAIDMEWVNKIQPYNTGYDVKFNHEVFNHNIGPLNGVGFTSLEFNSKNDIKSVNIGATINNYDIVKELGEENIRKTVNDAYIEYLKDYPDAEFGYGLYFSEQNSDLSNDELMKKYLDKYIDEIDSNYGHISSSTDFSFYDDDNIKVFSKDLKEYGNTTLQYIGIMPKNDSLDEYVENIDVKTINNITGNLKTIKKENFKEGVITKIIGQIPLFKFDYKLNLIDDLQSLGIKDVFSEEKSDLTKIISSSDFNTYIGRASHKATIEFSNDGIKAGAATLIGGLGGAVAGFDYKFKVPIEIIDLTFNKPYLFLIKDKTTNEIWFIGTVYEPSLMD